jgi:ParB-like chromosome segregation protein Spo0J
LADAALTSPDARRGDNDSLPRFAVKMLVERSAREEHARLALERVAWSRAISSDLRSIAVAGLAAGADESEAWRIVSRLGIEQDEQVRANALAALARNPAAESARMNAAPNPPTPGGDDRSPQGSGVHDE